MTENARPSTQNAAKWQRKYGKMWKIIEGGIRMVVWVGLVCFVLGANLGFLVAGLMRMAKDEKDTSEKP